MEWFPFISRRSHGAIVAGKDEQLRRLEADVEYLRAELSRSREENASTVEQAFSLMRPQLPGIVPKRRVQAEETSERIPETLDLSQVDPSDNEALVLIARREMPPGSRASATHVMRKVEMLREQVIEAHNAKNKAYTTPAYVPASVAAKIEAAEQAGVQQAKEVA